MEERENHNESKRERDDGKEIGKTYLLFFSFLTYG